NLAFEVLHLVEVRAPVQPAVRRARSAQIDRIAEPLAHAGQIPDATVLPAVVVTGGAAHVAVARQARVAGVVEQLLAREYRRRQLLSRDGGERADLHGRPLTARREVAHVEDAERAIHEVADVQAQPVGRDRKPLRSAAHVEAEQLAACVRVDDSHFAAGLERDEDIDAVRIEYGRGGNARVVVIDTVGVVLGARGEIDPRADCPDGVLERQVGAAAQRATSYVVLLRRHYRARAVRRDRDGSEVVRYTAPLVLR